MTGTPKPLRDYLREYVSEREMAAESARQLQYTLNNFEKFLERPATADDLNKTTVNTWLVWAAETHKLKPRSIKGRRLNLLTLWRWLYEVEVLAQGPRRIRKVTVPPSIPCAFTQDEVRKLLAVAEKMSGTFKKASVPVSVYWRAMIMAAYDSGLRRCDLSRIRREDIDGEGRMIVLQHKTKWPVHCQFGRDTMAAIDAAMKYPRELVFGFLDRNAITRGFTAIVRAAGFKGTLHKLRKTSATAVESISPGSGTDHLGHKSGDMARRFYIDPRLTGKRGVLPPRVTDMEPPDKGTGDSPPTPNDLPPFGGSIDTSSL